MEGPEWALVIVGIVTFVAIWYQARETARSAKAAEKSLEAIRRQVDIMERQTAILEQSGRATEANAAAAEASAKAAKESVEMLISKERARIIIEPGKLDMKPPGQFSPVHKVNYKVVCFGATPASVLDSNATLSVTDSEEPANSFFGHMPLPPVIAPDPVGIAKIALLFQKTAENVMDEVNRRKLFVHFHGFIKYRDVFGRDHETRFRYLWKVTIFAGSVGPLSYWAKHGSRDDNVET